MDSGTNVRLTAALKSLRDVTIMVEFAVSPCSIVSVVGEALMLKSGLGGAGGAMTDNARLVLCRRNPLVPVTDMLYDPITASLATFIVKTENAVLLDFRLTVVGFKPVLTPGIGKDEIVKLTSFLKPPTETTVMADAFDRPCSMLKMLGDAVIVKSGGSVALIILSGIFTLCSSVPLFPVTVIV